MVTNYLASFNDSVGPFFGNRWMKVANLFNEDWAILVIGTVESGDALIGALPLVGLRG